MISDREKVVLRGLLFHKLYVIYGHGSGIRALDEADEIILLAFGDAAERSGACVQYMDHLGSKV